MMRFFHFLEKEGLVLNYLKNNTLDKAQWYTFGHAQYCAFSNYTSYSPSVLFIDLEYLIISIEVFGAFLNVNFESTFWHSSPKMVDVFYTCESELFIIMKMTTTDDSTYCTSRSSIIKT